jgi:hypothetical protein
VANPPKPKLSAEDARREEESRRRGAADEAKRKKARDKRLDLVPPATDGAERRLTVESELLAPYALINPLPEIPGDPKLLTHAVDKEALVRYRWGGGLGMERASSNLLVR